MHFRHVVEIMPSADCGNRLACLLSLEKPPSLLCQLGHQQVTFTAAHTAYCMRTQSKSIGEHSYCALQNI
jgi:hypothetical protein